MPVNEVIINGEKIIDLTEDTVTAEDLPEGVTAHDASGNAISGKTLRKTLDLSDSSWDRNTWYPFVRNRILVSDRFEEITVELPLNITAVPWGGHSYGGAECFLDVLMRGRGWGATAGESIIRAYSATFLKKPLVSEYPIAITQEEHYNHVILWLRGGGIYWVYSEKASDQWTGYQESTTVADAKIAPVTEKLDNYIAGIQRTTVQKACEDEFGHNINNYYAPKSTFTARDIEKKYFAIKSESELTTACNEIYNGAGNNSTFEAVLNITSTDLSIPGGNWMITGYKADATYGFQEAKSYSQNAVRHYIRSLYNGVWSSWMREEQHVHTIASIYSATNEEQVTTYLDNYYNSVPDRSAFEFILNFSTSFYPFYGGSWYVTGYRSSGNYGYVEAKSYKIGNNHFRYLLNSRTDGEWNGWYDMMS